MLIAKQYLLFCAELNFLMVFSFNHNQTLVANQLITLKYYFITVHDLY